MATHWLEYDLHEAEGKKQFIQTFNEHMGDHNAKIVWHALCTDVPAVKNTRPAVVSETMTERTFGSLRHHQEENYQFNSEYIQCIRFSDNSIFGFRSVTLSLSNPNYIPVDNHEYFLVKDNRPCKALLIFEDGEKISKFKLQALSQKRETLNWFTRAANDFIKTFG